MHEDSHCSRTGLTDFRVWMELEKWMGVDPSGLIVLYAFLFH